MAIRDRLIDLEQRLKRLAGEPPPREPLEIRQALLRRIVDLTQPAGRGRRVLPFDRLDVDILAETVQARRVAEAVLAGSEGFDAAVRQALTAGGCTPAAHLAVEVHYRKRPLAGWADGQRFALAGRVDAGPLEDAAPSRREDRGPAGRLPAVAIRAVKGRVARKVVEVQADLINIGRGEEIRDRQQRLVRRNHVVFVEGDEASGTVSRAHAHIRCSPSGECRLRDDNSAHGTRIVRAGRTIEVAAGNTRGVRLQRGDELHFGRAVVRFDVA